MFFQVDISKYYRKILQKIKWKLLNQRMYIRDVRNYISWQYFGGKEFYKKHYQVLVSAQKWIFIVGCNNSGTSVLQKLFDKSNFISTFDLEGQRYTNVLPRAYKKGFERVFSEYKDALATIAQGDEIKAHLLHDWYRNLKHPLNEFVLEKTPANLYRMEFLQDVFPNSYFIGLVRNGFAVSEGIRRKGNKEIGRAASHWNEVNKDLIAESKKVDRYLEIKYEDLTENTSRVIRDLSVFLGKDSDVLSHFYDSDFNFETAAGDTRQKLVNHNRFSFANLNPKDIESIQANAHEMLGHFKYNINPATI